MIWAFDSLSQDKFARVDARLWAGYFRRKAKRLKVPLEKITAPPPPPR